MTEEPKPTSFMRDRKDVAEFVYKDYKEMERATFDVAAQWGRWLLASLILIHGGALFGLFSFLTELANNPAALRQYEATVWWFVAGILMTLGSGLLAWINWSMHSDNYGSMANVQMLWDPDAWVGDPKHAVRLDVTHYGAIILGIASALCIAGGANSILNSEWIPAVFSNLA